MFIIYTILLSQSEANDRTNVITVDWSNCSSSWNYVNTALNTQHASREIFGYIILSIICKILLVKFIIKYALCI